MIVALDFDGTLVSHAYPRIGQDLGAGKWLQEAAQWGVKFILFTMRDGEELVDAVKYCGDILKIDLYGVNTNPTQKSWTMSPKAYAQVYIDDCALGTPLDRWGCVDWSKMGPMLIELVSKDEPRNPIHNSGRYET